MRKKTRNTAILSLFALTLLASPEAFAQSGPRFYLEQEVDPALAMGPRVRTLVTLEPEHANNRRTHSGFNFTRRVGAAFWNRPYVYWTRGTYDGPTIIGAPALVADAPVLFAARPEPPTVAEIADEALRDGRYDEAVAHEEALAEDDAPAGDRLLIALEGAGRTGRAALLLTQRIAEAGPTGGVAALRVDRANLLTEPGEARTMQRAASGYASTAPDPNAWVLLASHLLGHGQREGAWRLIERAIEEGLEPEVAAALEGLRPVDPAAP